MTLNTDSKDIWEIEITQDDFDDYIEPYIGNGIIGCRFARLIINTDKTNPLRTLSKAVYDGGRQIPLPEWNHIDLIIDGIRYDHKTGHHQCTQKLDMKNAVVSLKDRWEYMKDKYADIEIMMVVPRTHSFGSILKISVSNIEGNAVLGVGIDGDHVSDHYRMEFSSLNDSAVMGSYKTARQNRAVCQVLKWNSSGLEVTDTNITEHDIKILMVSNSNEINIELFHAIGSYTVADNTCIEASKTADDMLNSGLLKIIEKHRSIWKDIWENALCFDNAGKETKKMLIAHQFYLLCSLEKCGYPLGALGLSYPGWSGSQLWDADFWIFRAILPLWPDFARSILNFRVNTMDQAKRHAKINGFDGLWYAWQTDDEGKDITEAAYIQELHLNIWIALSAWEYYIISGDKEYLKNSSWKIIKGIADFFVSRASLGNDGFFHINNVVGPDEAVCEHWAGHCDDNFLTNFGVKRLMEIADSCALTLEEKPNEGWFKIREGIYLSSPDKDGIIPEYRGYTGEGIKQADLILAFYPLGYEIDTDTMLKNVYYYKDKVMDYGPLMTTQIEGCIIMRSGKKEEGKKNLFDGMAEYMRGKHYIPFECRNNDISIMLTGIAGEMQAIIYGYYGYDLNSSIKIPQIKDENLI